MLNIAFNFQSVSRAPIFCSTVSSAGYLTLLEMLDILKINLNFFAGIPGILLEFCQVSWEFHGAMAFVAIFMMQLCLQ